MLESDVESLSRRRFSGEELHVENHRGRTGELRGVLLFLLAPPHFQLLSPPIRLLKPRGFITSTHRHCASTQPGRCRLNTTTIFLLLIFVDIATATSVFSAKDGGMAGRILLTILGSGVASVAPEGVVDRDR